MIVPTFLGIGVAKGGTTTLHHWLMHHPDVFVPKQKEVHFFDIDNAWARGLSWYKDLFIEGASASARGEISPGYFERAEVVIPRIQQAFCGREVRFVLLLRDPVARAYSYWNFRRCYYDETEDFETALKLEPRRCEQAPQGGWGYFRDGVYAHRLRQWIDAFGRERMCVILTEELRDDPQVVWCRLCRFLAVPEVEMDFHRRANAASQPRVQVAMRFLSNPPQWARQLGRVLMTPERRRGLRQCLYEWNAKPVKLPPIPSHVEQALRERYRLDILETARLIDRDLSHWLPR